MTPAVSRTLGIGAALRRRSPLALLLLFAASTAAADASGGTAMSAPVADLPVMGRTFTSFERFFEHITARNAECDEYYALRIYRSYRAACDLEGVSLVVALAQMGHETDYLRFTGSVRAVQYNFAGLGATSAGNGGLRFENADQGILAHVQHLKAYGSTEPLRSPLADPRFHFVVRGSAPTVRDLTGRWATDPQYAEKVLAHARALLM